MSWYPHVTVATIVQRNDEFLMVEEMDNGRLVINQPAGHLDEGESLPEAALRETREETAWEVALDDCVGVYQFHSPVNGVTYIRIAFSASAVRDLDTAIDPDISGVRWMTLDEIRSSPLRSPIVLQCILDALSGHRIPLSHIQQLG